MRKSRVAHPMRWVDEAWNQLPGRIARGETDGVPDWPGLERLGVTVTSNLDDALRFFCDEVVAAAPFPLDRQWIAATNELANEINGRVQEWRCQGGVSVVGTARAGCEIRTPFPRSPGLAQSFKSISLRGSILPISRPLNSMFCSATPAYC
jgi:hypothetical protein